MYLKTTPPPIPEPRDLPTGPPLVLDLAGVDALSAAGIGELVGLRSRLLASGGRLVLVNVGPYAWRAIAESGLSESLGVRRMLLPSPDEAEVAGREGGDGRACAKA